MSDRQASDAEEFAPGQTIAIRYQGERITFDEKTEKWFLWANGRSQEQSKSLKTIKAKINASHNAEFEGVMAIVRRGGYSDTLSVVRILRRANEEREQSSF